MPSDNSVAGRLKKRGIEEWEIRNAADTLMRAEEIKKDDDLFSKVKDELEARGQSLADVLKSVKK